MENYLQKTLYHTDAIKKLEEIAINEYKISVASLMDSAGKAAFYELQKKWPNAKKIIIVCGKGNNAGDGYVLARYAFLAGLGVLVLNLAPITELKGAAKEAAFKCRELNILQENFSVEKLTNVDVIVDAILGTGISGEVTEPFKNAILAVNNANIPILALDVPSGLNANTGSISGVSINATLTVTFIGLKQGFFTGNALDTCGEIILNDLNLPQEIFVKASSGAKFLNFTELKKLLPSRKKAANKGDYGKVLVVGGDYGMPGAVRMAGQAALRIGAGLVTIATRKEHTFVINAMRPELMCFNVDDKRILAKLLAKASILVIGPGFGNTTWSKKLLKKIALIQKPKVFDADALNLIAENNTIKIANSELCVFTPHPGEAARLLNTSASEIQKDRFSAIKKLRAKFGGTWVLKGAGSLVLGTEEIVSVCTYGNPGMASGGMGDVLSGVIGGLLAQGLDAENAAKFGVLLHSLAGDKAAKIHGERGLLALDLMPFLQELNN